MKHIGTLLLFILLTCCCVEGADDNRESFWSRISSFFTRKQNSTRMSAQPVVKLNSTAMISALKRAEEMISADNYTAAVEDLLMILETEADHQKANSLIGASFLALDRADVAESFLFTAVRMSNYTDVAAISNLAESLKKNNDLDLAMEVVQKSMLRVNKEDNNGILEYITGSILEQKGDMSGAAEWYLVSAFLKPNNEAAWLKASTVQFPAPHLNYSHAEGVLAQGLSLNSNSSRIAFNLGAVLHAENRLAEARVLYEEALRLDPSMHAATANLATLLHSMGKLSEALPVYKLAVANSPTNAVLQENYAIFLSSINRPSAAVAAIDTAFALNPNNTELKATRETLHQAAARELERVRQAQQNVNNSIRQSELDVALNVLRAFGEPSEDAAWWFYAAGMTQYLRGQYQNAFDLCRQSQRLLSSPSHMVFGCVGVTSQYLDRSAEAVKYFREAYDLMLQPGYEDPIPDLGFQMTAQDVQYNMIQALNMDSQFESCVEESLRILSLPPVNEGGGSVLVFSFLNWSDYTLPYLNEYATKESAAGRLNLPEGKSFLDEIRRVQSTGSSLITVAFTCMGGSENENISSIRLGALSVLSEAARLRPEHNDGNHSSTEEGLVLITQFFIPPPDVKDADIIRQALQDALARNLQNDAISEVYLINEERYDFSVLKNAHKITQFQSGRLTFADAFRVANERLSGRRVIVANADIYFDDSLQLVKHSTKLSNSTVLALSKWIFGGSSLSLPIRADSQDAWIFTAPIHENVVAQSDFFLGAPRCDNRLAKIFVDANYSVVNPAFTVHAIERDERVREHSIYSAVGSVPGPITQVLLSDAFSI